MKHMGESPCFLYNKHIFKIWSNISHNEKHVFNSVWSEAGIKHIPTDDNLKGNIKNRAMDPHQIEP